MIEIIKKLKEKDAVLEIKKQYGLEHLVSDSFDSLLNDLNNFTNQMDYSKLTAYIQSSKEEINNKKNFNEFGYTFDEARQYIESHGEKLVLTDADKQGIMYRMDEKVDSLDKLVLVHKTAYMPFDSKIETTKSAYERGATPMEQIEINGNSYEYNTPSARETVHFAVNGPVGGVVGGNDWDKMPYAILLPFNDVPKDKIGQAAPMDTFIHDDVLLSKNTYILCPEGEEEKFFEQNPNIPRENIIPFKSVDNYVLGFEHFVISNIIGAKPQTILNWSWLNEEDDKDYRNLMEANNLGLMPHSQTSEYVEEKARTVGIRWFAIIDILRREGLCKTDEEIEYIYEELNKKGKFSVAGFGQRKESIGYIEDELTKRLSKNGLPLPIHFTDEELTAIGIPRENERRDLFRACFPEVYLNKTKQKIEEIQDKIADQFCWIIEDSSQYKEHIPYMAEECIDRSINPINKKLEDMTLGDFLSLSSISDKTYLIANSKQMQEKCNRIFQQKGINISINYDNSKNNLTPEEVAKDFFIYSCNSVISNQLTNDNNQNRTI